MTTTMDTRWAHWRRGPELDLQRRSTHGGYPVNRRAVVVIVAGVAAVALLVVAASAGPVHVWSVPAGVVRPSRVDVGSGRKASAPTTIAPSAGPGDRRSTNNFIIQVLAVVLATGTLAALVVAVRIMRDGGLPQLFGRFGRRPGPPSMILPEFASPPLTLDAGAARSALLRGDPRNAIVACWMQLERDATAAGLGRHDAETSQEYVERVVAAASVDRVPIGELAALYREARFSRHPVTDGHLAGAAAALERVVAALAVRTGADA